MKIFEAFPNNEYVGTTKIAEMWRVDHNDLLELLKTRKVIEARVFNAAVNPMRKNKKPGDMEWEGHPICHQTLYIPLSSQLIMRLIKEKQIETPCITYDNKFACTPMTDENFDLTIDHMFIVKENAVKIAEEFGFGQQTPPLSLELTIAMDCYNTLYPKGPPSNPNRNNEAKKIIKWLKNNYTHMGDGENVNLREMLVLMVNPAPNKRIVNFPQRKK